MKRNRTHGFTLIELMIVVAILGILAAVAIPQYLGYVRHSKRKAVEANTNIAERMIRHEFAKAAAGGDATSNVVELLQHGNKQSPMVPGVNAFIHGTAPAADGQIAIDLVDLAAVSPNGSVILRIDNIGDGIPYADQTVSISKE